jgi:hypothetical protein
VLPIQVEILFGDGDKLNHTVEGYVQRVLTENAEWGMENA